MWGDHTWNKSVERRILFSFETIYILIVKLWFYWQVGSKGCYQRERRDLILIVCIQCVILSKNIGAHVSSFLRCDRHYFQDCPYILINDSYQEKEKKKLLIIFLCIYNVFLKDFKKNNPFSFVRDDNWIPRGVTCEDIIEFLTIFSSLVYFFQRFKNFVGEFLIILTLNPTISIMYFIHVVSQNERKQINKKQKQNNFYHLVYLDYCFHVYCYIQNVLTNSSFSLQEFHIELWSLYGTSNRSFY